MLREILKSHIVKPRYPIIYELEMAQYFRDCQLHYHKMVNYHGLLNASVERDLHLYDYKGRFYFENQTYSERYFKNVFGKPTEIVFRNCTFIGCDFLTDENLKFVFYNCRFDQVHHGSIGHIHNRFNGNLGEYVLRNIEHAMIICNRPDWKETSFDMTLENCVDISIYVIDYTKIHLNLINSSVRRLFLKHSNCLISQHESTMHSFLLLPPTGLDHGLKCTELFQTTNSVIREGLLEKSASDYYPVNLLRQLAKKHQYYEMLYSYNRQVRAKVPLEALQIPKRDFNIYLMQMFDFFAYPLSLTLRSLGVILLFTLLYMNIGLFNTATKTLISLNIYAPSAAHLWEVFSTALYFSITSFTTAGYGDYVPRHGYELVAGLEALIGVLYSGALLTSIFNRFHD